MECVARSSSLMKGTEMVLETSVYLSLTRLLARDYFIEIRLFYLVFSSHSVDTGVSLHGVKRQHWGADPSLRTSIVELKPDGTR
jgi:hypothetical protein